MDEPLMLVHGSSQYKKPIQEVPLSSTRENLSVEHEKVKKEYGIPTSHIAGSSRTRENLESEH